VYPKEAASFAPSSTRFPAAEGTALGVLRLGRHTGDLQGLAVTDAEVTRLMNDDYRKVLRHRVEIITCRMTLLGEL
jgi:hypothetical protein